MTLIGEVSIVPSPKTSTCEAVVRDLRMTIVAMVRQEDPTATTDSQGGHQVALRVHIPRMLEDMGLGPVQRSIRDQDGQWMMVEDLWLEDPDKNTADLTADLGSGQVEENTEMTDRLRGHHRLGTMTGNGERRIWGLIRSSDDAAEGSSGVRSEW